MLEKIKKKIKNYRKVKYQRILFSKSNIDLRDKAINYITNLENKGNYKSTYCTSCNFFYTKLNKKNFISFYKKFNSNIQLKEKYDIFSLKKKSNKNACFKSYILLSKFMMKDKRVNNIQKLNTILKINDLLILMFKKEKHSNLIKFFKQNINYEKKLLNLYL